MNTLKSHGKGMTMIFSQWKDDQRVPGNMPVLDRWVETHTGEKPLAGVTMLLIQHQLGNHVPQTQALLKLGLDPERLFWLDIPYTANPHVRDCLVRLGIPPANFIVSHDYQVLHPYSPYQRRRVQNILLQFFREPAERLVVLDDGAYFLEAMACFCRRLPRVAIVEQTTRGLIKMENSAVLRSLVREIPLVDVARSVPKKTLEPPFIGYAVCTALHRRLGHQFQPRGADRCLVLGFGVIGRQVAATMRELGFHSANVFVYDTDDDGRRRCAGRECDKARFDRTRSGVLRVDRQRVSQGAWPGGFGSSTCVKTGIRIRSVRGIPDSGAASGRILLSEYSATLYGRAHHGWA